MPKSFPLTFTPSTTSTASSTVSCPAQTSYDLFRVVREFVNTQLDEQQQRISESVDPFYDFLNKTAQGMLEIATAYKKGIEMARVQHENVQLLSKAIIHIESPLEVQKEASYPQAVEVVQETGAEIQENIPEAQELRELLSVNVVEDGLQLNLEVPIQDTHRLKRARFMSKKAQEMLELKKRKKF